MTNEELVLQIQQGRMELYGKLWVLNEPTKEDENCFLMDIIPDQSTMKAFEDIESEDWNERLHAILWEGLEALPHDQCQVIVYRFFDNMATKAIASRMSLTVSEIRQTEHEALRKLRTNGMLYRKLKPYYQEIKATVFDYYSTYKSSGISTTERNALRLAEKLEKYKVKV